MIRISFHNSHSMLPALGIPFNYQAFRQLLQVVRCNFRQYIKD
jgi:hypothetical protein